MACYLFQWWWWFYTVTNNDDSLSLSLFPFPNSISAHFEYYYLIRELSLSTRLHHLQLLMTITGRLV